MENAGSGSPDGPKGEDGGDAVAAEDEHGGQEEIIGGGIPEEITTHEEEVEPMKTVRTPTHPPLPS